ncbi:hypothetical protein PLICRDRAFT_373355, partial [Plicaturopsis crispa FD-325 SS-3]
PPSRSATASGRLNVTKQKTFQSCRTHHLPTALLTISLLKLSVALGSDDHNGPGRSGIPAWLRCRPRRSRVQPEELTQSGYRETTHRGHVYRAHTDASRPPPTRPSSASLCLPATRDWQSLHHRA